MWFRVELRGVFAALTGPLLPFCNTPLHCFAMVFLFFFANAGASSAFRSEKQKPPWREVVLS